MNAEKIHSCITITSKILKNLPNLDILLESTYMRACVCVRVCACVCVCVCVCDDY